jgi:hypothetical protein
MALFAALYNTAAFAGEVRGYALNWFNLAGHFDPSGKDCPDGLNITARDFYARELTRLGHPPREVERLLADFKPQGEYVNLVVMRGRVDGKPVNVYANPESVPDPQIKLSQGKFAPGFNLDGKVGATDHTDPQTNETGVDNRMARIMGCESAFRPQPVGPPPYPASVSNILMEEMRAYLIEVTDIDDPNNDNDVQVGFYVSLDRPVRASSGGIKSDMTMRVDPDPRWRNVTRGKIVDGVLITEPFSVNLLGDPWWIQAFHWHDARLRLDMKTDGIAKGMLGGYHPWFPFYWQFGHEGFFQEGINSLDIPGVWYALKKLADADPDPKTGQNMSISATYDIEAVPAFVVHVDKPAAKTAEAAR